MSAVHVLVPVKALGPAKSRLAHAVEPEARADLVLAMLQDTVTAALGAGEVSVTVVTSDARVARVARAFGAHVLPDPAPARIDPGRRSPDSPDSVPQDPLNAALRAAAAHVRAASPGVDLVALQADLPALRSTELACALEVARGADISIVADHTGTGTAALLHCVPSRPMHPLFGPDSARRHVDAGAHPIDDELPGLRLDVDTLDDLAAAATLGVGDATAAVLERIGFAVPVPCRPSAGPSLRTRS